MKTHSAESSARTKSPGDGENTTTKSLPIPAKAYEALGAVIDLGAECVAKLAALVSAKRDAAYHPNPTVAIREWAKELEVPEEVVSKVVMGVIIPANGLRMEYNLAQPAFVEAFRNSVEQRASTNWKKKYADKWPEIAAALGPMFAPDNFLSTAMKTAQLLGNQPAIFLDAKVLTELRPIYDEAAEKIQTLLMTNTLVLTYAQDGMARTVHLTMDVDDLRKLKDALHRAERKDVVAKRQAEGWGVGVLRVTNQES